MKASSAINAGIGHAQRAIDRPWLPYVARLGYAARGIVYLLVGKLAIFSAIGRESREGGQTDALHSLMDAPAGVLLLAIMAIGLVCFAVWRTIQAVLNVDHYEHNTKGFFVRLGLGISAVTHALLAFAAARMAWGAGGGGDQDGSRSGATWLMSQPGGRWIVAGVGVAIFITGIAHVVKAIKRKYEKRLDIAPQTLERLRPLFMFGLIARGFVFGVIAIFFLYAAWTFDPNQAGGLADVFNTVRRQPYGAVLLGLLAAGLFAFGVYGLAQARYRRVDAK